MSQDNQFFPTQIAQRSIEHPEEPLGPEKEEEEGEEVHSLRRLLTEFNSYDKEEKGLVGVEDVGAILASKGIACNKLREYHLMSLPVFENLASFDEFLFIYILAQKSGEGVEQQYGACRRVDERLLEFLRLLNNYRKKCERGGNYKEAKNSKRKIEEIRERELERRNKYLRILYDNEVASTEHAQKTKFEEFCARWDQFMNEYEATAADLLRKVRERQVGEIQEYEGRTKEELGSKMHFSKYLLELQVKERNLVRLQEYEKAGAVQVEIEEVRAKEVREKEVADLEVVELRLRAFRKQQEAALSTLLQKIQKDRNDHLKQRQAETEKMMVRNKTQLAEVDHRFNETVKRIYEALNNLGLQSEKSIPKAKK